MEHWFIAFGLIGVYLLPTIIAFMRDHASRWAILIINLFTSWTLIFWFMTLVWALANKGKQVVVINHNYLSEGSIK